MIGRIAGRVVYRAADHAMIDVQGVGYLVHCSERTLASLPGEGEAAALFTDLLVKEDLLQLMGFTTLAEKEWYRLLLSVQGVGAKAALAILGTLGPDGAGRAIALGDAASIKAAPGIGPKIAQRVVNELKDKAPAAMALVGDLSAPAGAPTSIVPPSKAAAPTVPGAMAEALSALGNLGYAPADAAAAVAEAQGADPEADTAALIRAALQLLAPKG
ncbi:MAG: Holliday junction branch migration protein RuvA [Rhodobacteraceae bacterium]|nr:Holliday junction branch migration protein RuvA [Paracoccaceae bacterium]